MRQTKAQERRALVRLIALALMMLIALLTGLAALRQIGHGYHVYKTERTTR